YSTRMPEGAFFGWLWYYMGEYEDPRHASERPDLVGKVMRPDVPYQAHSAADALEFYTATAGAAAFPSEYVGDAFAVLHGSWNRAFRTGHKIVRVPIENGVPTGEYIDFMVGFITEDGGTWGRNVSASVASDGSLLVSDDGANVIYRIAYTRGSEDASATELNEPRGTTRGDSSSCRNRLFGQGHAHFAIEEDRPNDERTQ